MTRGRMHIVAVVAAALLWPASIGWGQPAEFNYIKRETRQATRAATLAQYVPQLAPSSWHLAGPFDNTNRDKHDVVYPPELAIQLDDRFGGKDGQPVAWQVVEQGTWDPVNLKRFATEEANTDAIAYLYREVRCDRDAPIEFEIGSDDGLKLWLNGKLVIDVDVYRPLNVLDHTLELRLKEGRNTLLAKVTQGVGEWAFHMRPRLDPRVVAMLEYRLDLDFPTSREAHHYRLLTILEPPDVVLEVGGLDVHPDGRPTVATRRGEVWLIDGAYDDPPFDASFERFAFGLHEPLGARWRDGGLYLAQRGELTRLVDVDGDDRADGFQAVSEPWGLSGNYHEFAFGPKFDGRGRMWVALNLGFCGSLGKSSVPWRGWALTISDEGTLLPVCGGLRSPNGLGRNAAGDMFYTDNQGDWVGSGKLGHLEVGDWHGHPAGRQWYERAGLEPPHGDRERSLRIKDRRDDRHALRLAARPQRWRQMIIGQHRRDVPEIKPIGESLGDDRPHPAAALQPRGPDRLLLGRERRDDRSRSLVRFGGHERRGDRDDLRSQGFGEHLGDARGDAEPGKATGPDGDAHRPRRLGRKTQAAVQAVDGRNQVVVVAQV